ncbi:hypothetical protein EVAR_96155_1 [Eumeta japonica]|uniref:Uncharacterized protein n=1 Tax=Eumeta variegata TaxID=151549 RepID=A0A4C1VIY0_EUMVA|nr:hypothetical protein EVAR_96155_1 [Eumeta japonica]
MSVNPGHSVCVGTQLDKPVASSSLHISLKLGNLAAAVVSEVPAEGGAAGGDVRYLRACVSYEKTCGALVEYKSFYHSKVVLEQ